MPSCFWSLIDLMTRSLVVPCETEMVFPFRSSTSLMPELVFTNRRVPPMKVTCENSTCFWRVKVLVVEPHSRSIVPFATNGTRVCEITGICLICRLGRLSSALIASTILPQRSIE